MEDKLLDEFKSFCKFNCKYRKSELVSRELHSYYKYRNDKSKKYCYTEDECFVELRPCDYCQIGEFIREVSDRL